MVQLIVTVSFLVVNIKSISTYHLFFAQSDLTPAFLSHLFFKDKTTKYENLAILLQTFTQKKKTTSAHGLTTHCKSNIDVITIRVIARTRGLFYTYPVPKSRSHHPNFVITSCVIRFCLFAIHL